MNYHPLSDYHRKYCSILLVIITLSFFVLGITNSYAQVNENITLSTDKKSYLPGDIVRLSGEVVGQQPNVGIALEVIDSDKTAILFRTVQADQNGNFSVQFKIPPTATSGDFSVYASALIDGFHITQTKVFSATVPEFDQISGEVLGLAMISVILVFTTLGRIRRMR